MKFNCPYCRKELDYMEIQTESDLHAIIKMMPSFGKHAHLVSGYTMLFGITPLKIKAKKWRLLLEEMKTLIEQERFSYQKKTYAISAAGIVRALDIVIKKNFAEHLESHNYLKKVMIGISEEEAKETGRAAEKDLRAKEKEIMAGKRDSGFGLPASGKEETRTEESDAANLERVKGFLKNIG